MMQRGCALVAVLALLLSGCLTSEEPLITPDQADFPFESGTMFQTFDMVDGKITAREGKVGRLRIEDGFYFYKDDLRSYQFRANRIPARHSKMPNSTFYITMHPLTDGSEGFFYGLVREEEGFLITYGFTESDFTSYMDELKSGYPGWENLLHLWSLSNDESKVIFKSLPDLQLIDMVSEGFYTDVAAYKPIEGDHSDEALTAALVALGALILGSAIFADDSPPEAEVGSGEWRRWCWTDFLDPHPTDKPTWCRDPSGAEYVMPYDHPCYGVEGWCYR